ncbi:hypothetical protein EYF80_033385 [Liparis tanakae]|uniref:Uncharacterized protein n=1 Tax=Liparis tanakae TaxID=230148 RepID=A0A4Z2GUZ4_9TELE|nr:hypothetical protein EYF80_033385 [Liparis tanakae]
MVSGLSGRIEPEPSQNKDTCSIKLSCLHRYQPLEVAVAPGEDTRTPKGQNTRNAKTPETVCYTNVLKTIRILTMEQRKAVLQCKLKEEQNWIIS